MKDYIYMVKDALHDTLKGLNQLTDMENPSTHDIVNMSKSVHALTKACHELYEIQEDEDMPMHEKWGNADSKARSLFENLSCNYIGFWRCAAKYEETHSHEAKEKMLMYLENLLHAHEEMANFVMQNSVSLCEEVKAVVMKWHESK